MKKGAITILSTMVGMAIGAGLVGKAAGRAIGKAQNMSDKHLALFLMMNQWVKVKQEGKNLVDYFERHNYKTVAIYGMSYVGKRFCDELKGSSITVKYGIDRNVSSLYSDIDIVSSDDELEEVDVIIVTPIFYMDEIESMLSKKVDCPLLSLEDILYDE